MFCIKTLAFIWGGALITIVLSTFFIGPKNIHIWGLMFNGGLVIFVLASALLAFKFIKK